MCACVCVHNSVIKILNAENIHCLTRSFILLYSPMSISFRCKIHQLTHFYLIISFFNRVQKVSEGSIRNSLAIALFPFKLCFDIYYCNVRLLIFDSIKRVKSSVYYTIRASETGNYVCNIHALVNRV